MTVFDIEAELEAIAGALEIRQIDYAVCGGVAVAIHGHPRATTHIDLVVAPESLDAVLETVSALGYDLAAAPMRFASGIEVRRVSRLQAGEAFTLDLMPVTDVLRPAWDSRERVTWRGRKLGVVSRDGLVLMKRLAGRAQDLADLEALGVGDD
jgi:hypothetical protein